MARSIAITDTYLKSVFKLDTQSRKLTLTTVSELANNPKSTSLQIHSIERINCDPKFRSARINQDLRVIFLLQGDVYTLLYVDHHDDAYKWCEGKYLERTDFGSEYIYDEKIYQKVTEKRLLSNSNIQVESESLMSKKSLKAKHLQKIGISEIHCKNLLSIDNDDEFIEYIEVFPSETQEALLDLVAGTKSIEEVYNNLLDLEFSKKDNPILQKDSSRRFYITQSMAELEILTQNDDFEKWQIFLHPEQQNIVRRNFNGPALVEGGPGTGKTIVGIHRAVFLSENIFKKSEDKKILICSFSKKLSKLILEKIAILCSQRNVESNIDVINVDQLISEQIRENGLKNLFVNQNLLLQILDEEFYNINPIMSKNDYFKEYFEIIERNNISRIQDYIEADRSGMGIGLDTRKREKVWSYFEKVLAQKKNKSAYSFVDRAQIIVDANRNGLIKKIYDSIIIDESQDLENVKLKAILSFVKDGPNNIMLLSDVNQRIFRIGSWKKDLELNVKGRVHYLNVNYRTTKQINDYAKNQFMQTNIEKHHIKNYKSIFSGDEPRIIETRSQSEQLKKVFQEVDQLIKIGYRPDRICVICNSKDECQKVQGILEFSSIKSIILQNDILPSEKGGVCICPIHGVKGLEFEVVIIYNFNNIGKARIADETTISKMIDEMKLIECEKYVATTRARNELIITYLEGETDDFTN